MQTLYVGVGENSLPDKRQPEVDLVRHIRHSRYHEFLKTVARVGALGPESFESEMAGPEAAAGRLETHIICTSSGTFASPSASWWCDGSLHCHVLANQNRPTMNTTAAAWKRLKRLGVGRRGIVASCWVRGRRGALASMAAAGGDDESDFSAMLYPGWASDIDD